MQTATHDSFALKEDRIVLSKLVSFILAGAKRSSVDPDNSIQIEVKLNEFMQYVGLKRCPRMPRRREAVCRCETLC